MSKAKRMKLHFGAYPLPPVVAADARNLLIFNKLRENLQNNLLKKYKKGSRSGGLVMPFLSLMALKSLMYEKHNPLESTVHISHIAQYAVAGERHAFSLEEDRRQKTECAERRRPSFRADLDRREREVENSHRANAVISSAAERSREILSCRNIAKRDD